MEKKEVKIKATKKKSNATLDGSLAKGKVFIDSGVVKFSKLEIAWRVLVTVGVVVSLCLNL